MDVETPQISFHQTDCWNLPIKLTLKCMLEHTDSLSWMIVCVCECVCRNEMIFFLVYVAASHTTHVHYFSCV